MVIGIPDSGIIAAKSYANKLNLNYNQWIHKNPNAQRSFIQNNNKERNEIIKTKFVYDKDKIKDKIIIIVDDTIVRGNVIKNIIMNIKHYGAKEIHVRIPSPPVRHICQFGVDIPTQEELLAHQKYIHDIKKSLNVNSIIYLTNEDLNNIISPQSCKGCFSGCYPAKALDW